MSKTIGGILVFVALVFLVIFILALLALLDIGTTKTGVGPHNAFFASFGCGTDCIKAMAGISPVVFLACSIVGGLFLRNKNG